MPKMRKIVPAFRKPEVGYTFCTVVNKPVAVRPYSTYHVSLDDSHLPIRAMCGVQAREGGAVWSTNPNTNVEVGDVCTNCLKYTKEVV